MTQQEQIEHATALQWLAKARDLEAQAAKLRRSAERMLAKENQQ